MRQQHNKMGEQVKKRHAYLIFYLTIISIYSVYLCSTEIAFTPYDVFNQDLLFNIQEFYSYFYINKYLQYFVTHRCFL